MEFYFLNWVQLSCDFGKVIPNGTTQGKVYQYQHANIFYPTFL
jgi:hypothetical protein